MSEKLDKLREELESNIANSREIIARIKQNKPNYDKLIEEWVSERSEKFKKEKLPLLLGDLLDQLLDKHNVPRKVILAKVFIIEDTGWDEGKVKLYMKNIQTIYNLNNVMFRLDIKNFTSLLVDDKDSNIIKNFYHIADFHLRPDVGNYHFFDETKKTFIYVFTEEVNTEEDGGVRIPDTTTAVMSKRANNSTAAHETGHIMGLDDTRVKGGNNLMDYGRSDNILEIFLTEEQRQIANDFINKL